MDITVEQAGLQCTSFCFFPAKFVAGPLKTGLIPPPPHAKLGWGILSDLIIDEERKKRKKSPRRRHVVGPQGCSAVQCSSVGLAEIAMKAKGACNARAFVVSHLLFPGPERQPI